MRLASAIVVSILLHAALLTVVQESGPSKPVLALNSPSTALKVLLQRRSSSSPETHEVSPRKISQVGGAAHPRSQRLIKQSPSRDSRSTEEAVSLEPLRDNTVPPTDELPTEGDAPFAIDMNGAYRIARKIGRTLETRKQSANTDEPRRPLKPEEVIRQAIMRAARPSCHTAHADKGLLAIPFLLKDAVTDTGCKW